MKNNHSYFKNLECEFYPCHKIEDDAFNCLFCYCPLYGLGEGCGGNFTYTQEGIKDCSGCMLPHSKDGYQYIVTKLLEIDKNKRL